MSLGNSLDRDDGKCGWALVMGTKSLPSSCPSSAKMSSEVAEVAGTLLEILLFHAEVDLDACRSAFRVQ